MDSIITDPPAGISFMGRSWDTFDKDMFGKKGEEGINDLKVKKDFDILPRYGNSDLQAFQDFICKVFTEAIRVLKPGGHCLVWAIPRTSHHTAMGLERAGFEIRDIVHHIFGQGFPKSRNIGNGLGTALKPAVEHWILCRKPLSEKTVVANVLKWGTGAINIDESRIPYDTNNIPIGGFGKMEIGIGHPQETMPMKNSPKSMVGTDMTKATHKVQSNDDRPSVGKRTKTFGDEGEPISGGEDTIDWKANPTGRFPANLIVEDIAGTWVKYFYCPKASKKDKNKGLSEEIKNTHPTTKNTILIKYLIQLITPKGGIVMDMFGGSGSTGVACKELEYRYILIEKDKGYMEIARKRLKI